LSGEANAGFDKLPRFPFKLILLVADKKDGREDLRMRSHLTTKEGVPMNVNANGYGALAGKLVNTLMEGQQKQTELALKTIEVVAQQQLAVQQQQTTLLAVAMLTGVGSKLNVFV
jgi:hypothetical protein